MAMKIKMKPFNVPKAMPNTETTICQYMAMVQNNLKPCKIDPTKEFCALGIIGVATKDGVFTPITPNKYDCPKIRGVK